jgi:hypothetical protein
MLANTRCSLRLGCQLCWDHRVVSAIAPPSLARGSVPNAADGERANAAPEATPPLGPRKRASADHHTGKGAVSSASFRRTLATRLANRSNRPSGRGHEPRRRGRRAEAQVETAAPRRRRAAGALFADESSSATTRSTGLEHRRLAANGATGEVATTNPRLCDRLDEEQERRSRRLLHPPQRSVRCSARYRDVRRMKVKCRLSGSSSCGRVAVGAGDRELKRRRWGRCLPRCLPRRGPL